MLQVVAAVAQALSAPWSAVLALFERDGKLVPAAQALTQYVLACMHGSWDEPDPLDRVDARRWHKTTGIAKHLIDNWAKLLVQEFDVQLLD